MRKYWTTEEIELLRAFAASGRPFAELSEILGRTRQSVQHKASRLSITFIRKPIDAEEGEVWRKSYVDDVLVSNRGRFKRDSTKSKLSGTVLQDGYVQIEVSQRGTSIKCYAHRLVAEAFLENPDNKPEVNHKNRDKADNSAANLEWVTRSENMIHAHATGFRRR